MIPYFAPEAAIPITSCAPRFAEIKARLVIQSGIDLPLRRKSWLLRTCFLTKNPMPKTKTKYYQSVLNKKSTDLLDLGTSLKRKFNLSWVGRPVFYPTPTGSHEMMFHGVVKDIAPHHNFKKWPKDKDFPRFFRCIFKTSVHFKINKEGQPTVEIADSKYEPSEASA